MGAFLGLECQDEADPLAWDGFYLDFDFMGIGDALGNGKSQAVAAGISGTGGVTAVETFKDFFLFLFCYALSGIEKFQHLFIPCLLECNPNFSFGVAILHGIIHEDSHQLFDMLHISGILQVFLNVQFQLFFLFKGLALKWQGGAGDGGAEGKGGEFFFRAAHFQFCQIHHLIDQNPHTLRLRVNIAEPLIFSDFIL